MPTNPARRAQEDAEGGCCCILARGIAFREELEIAR